MPVGGVLLLAAMLLALCFALAGCNYEDLFPTHEHNFEKLGYLYGEAVYEDGVITDVKRVPCGQWRTSFEYYVCSICGKPLYMPIGGGGQQTCDTNGRYKVTTEPTCTKAGVETATCFYCHKVYTKSIPALGHDYKTVAAKAATCTEAGNTAGKKCRRCGHLHDCEELPALGHDWGAPSYTWGADNATCTAARVCSRDASHVETETVNAAVQTKGNACIGGSTHFTATFENPAFQTQTATVNFDGVGHTEEVLPAVTPTCAKTGLTEGKKCAVCGEILAAQQTLDKDPDNHAGPFMLPRGGVPDVPSTCSTQGYRTEGICAACGNEDRTKLPLDPDNHDWGAPSYEWSADYATCTAKRTCQRDGRHVETKTVKAAASENTATCEAAGTITYTAEFPAPFETQTKTVDTPALGHTGGTATCTEQAVCDRCGKAYGEMDPTNHNNAGETKKFYSVKTDESEKYYFNYYCNQCKKLLRTVEGNETETEGVDMEPDDYVPDEGGAAEEGNE